MYWVLFADAGSEDLTYLDSEMTFTTRERAEGAIEYYRYMDSLTGQWYEYEVTDVAPWEEG